MSSLLEKVRHPKKRILIAVGCVVFFAIAGVIAAFVINNVQERPAVVSDDPAVSRPIPQERASEVVDKLQRLSSSDADRVELRSFAEQVAASDDMPMNDRVAALESLAGIHIEDDNKQAALDTYKRMLELAGPRHTTYLAIGYSYDRLGREAEARDNYEKAIAMWPEDDPLREVEIQDIRGYMADPEGR